MEKSILHEKFLEFYNDFDFDNILNGEERLNLMLRRCKYKLSLISNFRRGNDLDYFKKFFINESESEYFFFSFMQLVEDHMRRCSILG
jgi:hypothetical protein